MMKDGRKIVFVGVPMAGKDEAVIKRAIQVAKAKYLKATGQNIRDVVFIDNFDSAKPMDDCNESIWYLGRALKRLAIADEAVFGEGWHKARGCIIETEVCGQYGIPATYIIDYEEDDEIGEMNFIDENDVIMKKAKDFMKDTMKVVYKE